MMGYCLLQSKICPGERPDMLHESYTLLLAAVDKQILTAFGVKLHLRLMALVNWLSAGFCCHTWLVHRVLIANQDQCLLWRIIVVMRLRLKWFWTHVVRVLITMTISYLIQSGIFDFQAAACSTMHGASIMTALFCTKRGGYRHFSRELMVPVWLQRFMT
jgi:hypothetical protein